MKKGDIGGNKNGKKHYNIKSAVVRKDKFISVNRLIDRVNRDKKLTREEKFEKLIDIGFKRIYEVKGESWDNNFKRAEILTNIVEKDTNNGMYYKIKDIIKRHI